MRLQLAQMTGIARYEMKMLWRGRPFRVILLALLVINVVTALEVKERRSHYSVDVITWVSVDSIVWSNISMVLAFALPVILADIIPKDRQFGVCELLDTLPVTRGAYLLGKLLGVYRSLFTGLIALMIVIGVSYHFALANISWSGYLEMWCVGAGGLAIMNGGLGVLLPAAQPTRRRAIVLMIIVLVPFYLAGGDLSRSVVTYLSPARLPFLMYHLIGLGGTFSRSRFTFDDVLLSFLVGVLELIIIGVVVWAWPRWRENRISGRE